MKYIKLFNEALRLKDIKGNRAPYYHATDNFNDILKENILQGYSEHEYTEDIGISVSRNPNFIFNNARVVFILDGQKISNRYKIIQHNYWGDKNPQEFEFEDFIIGDLKRLDKYIIGVGINYKRFTERDFEYFKNNLKKYINDWNLKNFKIFKADINEYNKDKTKKNKFHYKNWEEI